MHIERGEAYVRTELRHVRRVQTPTTSGSGFVFVVNCMFVYYLYNWVVMFVKGVIDLRAVLASELQYMSSRVLE